MVGVGNRPVLNLKSGLAVEDDFEMDLEGLRNSHSRGDTIEWLAEFLCRDVEKVGAKLPELRLAHSETEKRCAVRL